MTALSHEQWSRLNGFALELHAETSREHFFHCCLERLPKVLGVGWIGWNEMDQDYRFVGFRVSEDFQDAVVDVAEEMEHTISTNPLIEGLGLQHREGPMTGIHLGTDFVSERQMKERAIYQEAYRHVETLYQMYAEMYFTPAVRSSLTMNSLRPIGEEQRLMTELASQHLVVAFRNLLRREAPPPWFSEQDPRKALVDTLGPRLRETLGHLLNGLSRKLIADEMGLSIHTLNDYVRELYSRLGVHSHAELMAAFRNEGKDL